MQIATKNITGLVGVSVDIWYPPTEICNFLSGFLSTLQHYYVINLIVTYILCGFVVWGWVPGRWLISHEGASVCGGPRYII